MEIQENIEAKEHLSSQQLENELIQEQVNPQSKQQKRDRSNENLKKRWRTLVKTGRELQRKYGANIYFSISVPYKGKDYIFRSAQDTQPLLNCDIERRYPPPVVITGYIAVAQRPSTKSRTLVALTAIHTRRGHIAMDCVAFNPDDDTHGEVLHGPLVAATLPANIGRVQHRNFTFSDDGVYLNLVGDLGQGVVDDLWWKRLSGSGGTGTLCNATAQG